MPINVICDNCFEEFQVSSKFAGKKIRCKLCHEPTVVSQTSNTYESLQPLPEKSVSRKKKPTKRKKKRQQTSKKSTNYLRLVVISLGLLVGVPVALIVLIPPITNLLFPNDIQWTEVQINQGAVTLKMLNPPKVKHPNNPNGISVSLYQSKTRKMSCDAGSLSFSNLAGSVLKVRQNDLESAKKYGAISNNIKLESEEMFDLHEVQAIRYIGKLDTSSGMEFREEAILFCAGNNIYYINFMEPYRLPQKSIRQEITNSIVLSEKTKFEYLTTQAVKQ